jgi:hypothetical protein
VNLGQIRAEVYAVCQEAGYSTDEVDSYINEALKDVCSRWAIPDLKLVDVVSTVEAVAYVSLLGLTGGFSGRLVQVRNTDGNKLRVYPNLELLMDDYPTMAEAGDVEAVALEGSLLWYQYVPATAEVLTVVYYRNPSALSSDEDEPTVIPEHLQRGCLVAGAAWIMFDKLEDGLEGEKVNTTAQFAQYNRGIVAFGSYLGMRKTHYISSRWDV